ncbi:MAG: hypothetical protein GY861_04575 [bacterium]|nr:hypothetical protein [bacterium]
MWAKLENLTKAVHNEEWLIQYKEILGKDYKTSEVCNVEEVAVHFGCGSYLSWSYSNVEDCICCDFYADDTGIVDVQSLEEMREVIHSGKQYLSVYGITDLGAEEDEVLDILFSNYPELLLLGEDKTTEYILNLEIVEEGVRFHKNGGYRGKEIVGESVAESPSDEYLMFSVYRIKQELQ